MTRLTDAHIQQTRTHLKRVDDMLRLRVGTGLRGVALRTIGVREQDAAFSPSQRVAVVPISAGEGIIAGFSEAVCAIVEHVGLQARVTRGSDVSGLAEAYAGDGDIVVLADDSRFVAIHTGTGALVDNDRATGEGFAALAELMGGPAAGRPAGVIGSGPVGSAAALRLAKRGADLTVCDRDEKKCRALAARIQERCGVEAAWSTHANRLLSKCHLLVDATPAAGIIPADAIGPETVIAAPGVPVGLTPEALDRIGTRCYHDNLPLGVATMVLAAACGKMTATAQFRYDWGRDDGIGSKKKN